MTDVLQHPQRIFFCLCCHRVVWWIAYLLQHALFYLTHMATTVIKETRIFTYWIEQWWNHKFFRYLLQAPKLEIHPKWVVTNPETCSDTVERWTSALRLKSDTLSTAGKRGRLGVVPPLRKKECFGFLYGSYGTVGSSTPYGAYKMSILQAEPIRNEISQNGK